MKSIVTMTTKHGVSYKRTKCLDEWTDNVHYNTLEVDG